MKKYVSVESNISLEKIVRELEREQSVKIIKMIDRYQEDWSFTKKIGLYFIKELQICFKEIADSDSVKGKGYDKSFKKEITKLYNIINSKG